MATKGTVLGVIANMVTLGNMLWCDELNFQLITSVICSKKMLTFPDSG